MSADVPSLLRTKKFAWWARLAAILALAAAEVVALTTQVEFTAGPMAWTASPLVFSGGIVGLAAFLILAWDDLGKLRSRKASSRRRVIILAVCHAAALAAFFLYTRRLHLNQAGVTWLSALFWCLLAAAVAMSALAIVVPLRRIAALVKDRRIELLVAVLVGVSLVLLTPTAQILWLRLDDTAVTVIGFLLEQFQGESFTRAALGRSPIIGTSELRLTVTPACSEMDSILAFLLLGGTLWVARWHELATGVFAGVLAVGVVALYLLNAVRLWALIAVGLAASSAQLCVQLAHSRISGILFLAISLAILSGGARWARKAG